RRPVQVDLGVHRDLQRIGQRVSGAQELLQAPLLDPAELAAIAPFERGGSHRFPPSPIDLPQSLRCLSPCDPSGRGRPSLGRGIGLSQRPYASRRRSHSSDRVGNAGTACQRSSSGTSPTTATVAAWSASAISGPVIVAPTTMRRSSSTTSRAVPGAFLPTKEPPAFPPVSTSTVRTRSPASSAAASVRPTAPTWGSVKITRGEAPPSERSRTVLPMIASAASRAWYLPMCVRSARPLTSPTAYSQSFPA